jgi:hypothetical protein
VIFVDDQLGGCDAPGARVLLPVRAQRQLGERVHGTFGRPLRGAILELDANRGLELRALGVPGIARIDERRVDQPADEVLARSRLVVLVPLEPRRHLRECGGDVRMRLSGEGIEQLPRPRLGPCCQLPSHQSPQDVPASHDTLLGAGAPGPPYHRATAPRHPGAFEVREEDQLESATMISRVLVSTLVAAAIAIAAPACAKDEAKAECKQNCQITLQSCRQDCQIERDSGTDQESYLYRQCDQGCHDTYSGCVSSCETR